MFVSWMIKSYIKYFSLDFFNKCYLWLRHHSSFHKQTVEHAMEIGEVLTLDTVDLNWCHTH